MTPQLVPGLLSETSQDPRSQGVALDFADMQNLIADLIVPDDASMCVMSGLETCRELLRHSFHRYEFATVAVTHSLVVIEHVLAERLAVDTPLPELVDRAVEFGLITQEIAAGLHECLRLRGEITRGRVTSAALTPQAAVARVRLAFDVVAVLHPATSSTKSPAAVAVGEGSDARLARLREVHHRAAFPASFRGVDIAGVELVLLDADIAALAEQETAVGLDGEGISRLWACLADLGSIEPLINERYCALYFADLRTLAEHIASRHVEAAT